MTSTTPARPAGLVDRVVSSTIVPIAELIPVLVRSGVLLVAFATLWVAFFAAIVLDPSALTSVRTSIEALPLPVQALVWLLFLPVMAGLWIWGTDWPLAVRLVLVAALAAWNLLVFVPHGDPGASDPDVAAGTDRE
jgi:hypothetical protein